MYHHMKNGSELKIQFKALSVYGRDRMAAYCLQLLLQILLSLVHQLNIINICTVSPLNILSPSMYHSIPCIISPEDGRCGGLMERTP